MDDAKQGGQAPTRARQKPPGDKGEIRMWIAGARLSRDCVLVFCLRFVREVEIDGNRRKLTGNRREIDGYRRVAIV